MKKLNDIPGKNPFKVPENYFSEVNRKIISLTSEAVPEPAKARLSSVLRPYLAIAASIAILLIISFTALNIFITGKGNNKVPQITREEFSETYLNEIDILTLEDQAWIPAEPWIIPDLNNSEIINYLILENIDINELYEYL